MIKKPILVTLAMSLLFCSGCAKNRWLSRRDYSEMQDPFMEEEAVADTVKPRRAKTDTAGRARLSSSLADTQSGSDARDAVPLLGPKPILRTSATNDPSIRSGRIAKAGYPREPETKIGADGDTPPTQSYEGPALSDFLQRRRADRDPAAAVLPAQSQLVMAQPRGAQGSLAARAVAVPTLSAEAQGFNSFLTEKSTAAATTAQRGANAVQRGANTVQQVQEDAGDFASWAQQQKANWSATGEGVPDAGSTEEQAQPLIRKLDTQKPAQEFDPKFAAEKSSGPEAKKEVNPFDDPFAPSFDSDALSSGPPKPSPTAKSPADSTTPRGQLDDSFRMDSGWKPSHLTRP